MTEATNHEMLAAVERWARARGWLRYGRARSYHEPAAGWSWMLDVSDDGVRIHRGSAKPVDIDGWGVDVSPHAALVLALVIEARPLRDGTACRRCFGRGEWAFWSYTYPLDRGSAPFSSHGLCPDCAGTGLADLTDEFAQHVLDAQPTQHGNPAVYVWTRPGEQASIEALHVLADLLQPDLLRRADGPPRDFAREALGIHIAHLLAGKREGTADAVELLLLAPYKFTSSAWSPTGVLRATTGAPGETVDIRAALDWQDSSPPFRGPTVAARAERCQACALGRAHTQALHDAGLDPAAESP